MEESKSQSITQILKQNCQVPQHQNCISEFVCVNEQCAQNGLFCNLLKVQHESHQEDCMTIEEFSGIIGSKKAYQTIINKKKIEQAKLLRVNAFELKEKHLKCKMNFIKIMENANKNLNDRVQEIDQLAADYEEDQISKEIAQLQAQPQVTTETINQLIKKWHSQMKKVDGKLEFSIDDQENLYQLQKIQKLKQYLQEITLETNQLENLLLEQIPIYYKMYEEIISPKFLALIEHLKEKKYLKTPEVVKVYQSIDRADFASKSPYLDQAQEIGYNTTISAPHMHAYTLEVMYSYIKNGKKCLDIGTGSGFMTLAMAKILECPQGITFGLDHLKGVLKIARENISKNHKNYLTEGKIILCQGDGREGLPDYAPFDVIHLGAAASLEAVNKFIDQLAPDGILCGPIIYGDQHQEFTILKKGQAGDITKNPLLQVMYGELKAKKDQWNKPDLDEEDQSNNQQENSVSQAVVPVEDPNNSMSGEEDENNIE